MSHDYEHKEPQQQQQQQQSQTQHPLAPGPSHSPHALAPAPAPAPAPPPAGASPTSAGAGLGLGLGNPFLRARSDLQQEQHFGSSFSLPQHLPDFATPGTSSLEQQQQQQQYQDAPLLTSFPNLASVQATLSALAPSPGFPPGDMHQGSVLSTRPPHLPTGGGLRSALAGLHTSAIGTSSMHMAGMMSLHQPSLHLEQLEHQAPHPPPAMDDFFDQMFSFSSPWTEIGGRSSWDYDANAGAASTAPDAGSVPPPKLFTMSLMPPGESLHYGTDERHDPSMVTRLSHQHQLHHQDLPALAPGSGRLQRSPSVGSSGSEGSPGQQQQHAPRDQSPPPIAPTWRQPYVGGVPPLPMASLGDAATSEALLGKRGRDEEDMSRDGRSAGSTHGNAPSQGLSPPMQGGQIYGAPPGHAPHQPAAPVVARPRVRARRGQATDPHSIAERLRRERIAERMKALQELVPNSNKTDKASMLDEIIDYVKFLQLQVKVLSMSRLGGAGAVAPLVADLPSEGPSSFVAASIGRSGAASGPASEGLALTEREVARLMEEDMGTAMQYLQSKGLCLMPISLATAISSNGPRPQTAGGAHGTPAPGLMSSSAERQRQEQSVAMSSSPGVPGLPAAARVTRDTWEAGSGDKANPGSAESTKSPAAGSKPTLDSPRRGQ